MRTRPRTSASPPPPPPTRASAPRLTVPPASPTAGVWCRDKRRQCRCCHGCGAAADDATDGDAISAAPPGTSAVDVAAVHDNGVGASAPSSRRRPQCGATGGRQRGGRRRYRSVPRLGGVCVRRRAAAPVAAPRGVGETGQRDHLRPPVRRPRLTASTASPAARHRPCRCHRCTHRRPPSPATAAAHNGISSGVTCATCTLPHSHRRSRTRSRPPRTRRPSARIPPWT